MENYFDFIENQINEEYEIEIKGKNNNENNNENDNEEKEKEKLNKINTKILLNFNFIQLFFINENLKEENLINEKNVIITNTNHKDIDLDSYYVNYFLFFYFILF